MFVCTVYYIPNIYTKLYNIPNIIFKPLLSYCQEQFFYATIKTFYLGRFWPKMGFIFKCVQFSLQRCLQLLRNTFKKSRLSSEDPKTDISTKISDTILCTT